MRTALGRRRFRRLSALDFTVADADDGARLDQWLARALDCSRRQAQRLIDEGGVRVDGARAAKGSRVRVVTVGSDEFFELVEARRGRKRLTYVVKKGDDLKRIGKRFNLSVADLERINRFGANHTDLTVGQKLTVYVPMSAAEKAKAACALTPGGLAPDSKDKEPEPIVDEEEAARDSLPRPPPPDGRP